MVSVVHTPILLYTTPKICTSPPYPMEECMEGISSNNNNTNRQNEVQVDENSDFDRGKIQKNVFRYLVAILLLNICLISITVLISTSYAGFVRDAMLAYSLGLRHAVDADHITAIDSVTRSFVSKQESPLSLGFFFSLGYSTIVIVASIISVSTSELFIEQIGVQNPPGYFGSLVSSSFILLLGLLNLGVFIDLSRKWRKIKRGEEVYEDQEKQFSSLKTCHSKMTNVIDKSWKMYPLGILVGLRFDAATDVALLALSTLTSYKELPIGVSLLLPLLFTAGMSLVDTFNGMVMVWTYHWGFTHPAKKIFYNLFLTGASIIVAVLIGSIGLVGFIVDRYNLSGDFWDIWRTLSYNFEILGYIVIGILVFSLVFSALFYAWKFRRHDLCYKLYSYY